MDRRIKPLTTMTRCRVIIGLLSITYGIGGYVFHHNVGLSGVVLNDEYGWLWPVFLILFGGMMTLSAIAEIRGRGTRSMREFSAALLSVTWVGIFFYSFQNGASTITLISPVMVGAVIWAWISEGRVARVIAQNKATNAP